MAVVTYPFVLSAVLLVLFSPSPTAARASALPPASDATVLVDADARLDGRWGRASGNIALHAARPLATWQADLAVWGLRVRLTRDAAGVHADFDASGVAPALVRSLMPR